MTDVRLLAAQAAPAATPVDPGLDTVRAIVALIAVTIVLAGFLWLLKRGTFAATSRGGRQGLAIESAISLGERRSLVIVGVEGRRLLLGLSPAQVNLIAELGRAPTSFGTALDGAIRPAGEGTRS
jgi:flagellar biosynthetic protein FliO